MNILVTNFLESGENVMIFSGSLNPMKVAKRLTERGEYFEECYEVPSEELSFYCYEPCWIK